jgi:proliferating cell nuclear antigen
MDIHCSEEKINLISSGTNGEMKVSIPIDDLTEYSISEDDKIDTSYSLSSLSKMCLSNKLSNEIQFSISKEYPMRIKYDLGDDSFIRFFLAPRVND